MAAHLEIFPGAQEILVAVAVASVVLAAAALVAEVPVGVGRRYL